jgi:hypothetical protein
MIRNKLPAGEPFVWLTRELLSSDAWRSQNIHTRRLIDFLLLEHIRRGGQNNGRLKAPQRQLYAFGIGPNYAVAAIVRAEELGLVVCHRAGMRTATTYRLTWLESYDGKPAGNEWRAYRNPNLSSLPTPKSEICLSNGRQGCLSKARQMGQICLSNSRQMPARGLPIK